LHWDKPEIKHPGPSARNEERRAGLKTKEQPSETKTHIEETFLLHEIAGPCLEAKIGA